MSFPIFVIKYGKPPILSRLALVLYNTIDDSAIFFYSSARRMMDLRRRSTVAVEQCAAMEISTAVHPLALISPIWRSSGESGASAANILL